MSETGRRALHFVYKIGNRTETAKFYKEILGMKVLRHEEFEEGCAATCNGPYNGKWSKTMIGYGSEDNHFVCELTYNYEVNEYAMGNDFRGMFIQSSDILKRARAANLDVVNMGDSFRILAPGGYKFFIVDKPQPVDMDPVLKVCLSCSNLKSSIDYWGNLLQMNKTECSDKMVSYCYAESQTKIVFEDIGGSVDHGKAFGRVAFSCPSSQLKEIESSVLEAGHKVITPYISLDTPGKATVEVVILADPDGHEICFVGDGGFRSLSQVDPEGEKLLNEAIEKDKSAEWFDKRGGKGKA